jgi:hypothetical protein
MKHKLEGLETVLLSVLYILNKDFTNQNEDFYVYKTLNKNLFLQCIIHGINFTFRRGDSKLQGRSFFFKFFNHK